MPLSPGTRLGRYEVLSQLGAGGMGEVYLAHDTRLKRRVALKVLPPDLVNNLERLRRFEQEARAASALNHPNIITIHEIGAEGETHFIATEFIEGVTLRHKLQTPRVEIEETLNIVTQIAAALDAAHSSRIVHRDIKPENVMLRADGFVKVLDFGLAKLTEKKEDAIADTQAPTQVLVKTTPGVVVGTIAYMSPEQVRGLEVDARTDIFSLGIVAYEMLTGRLPFAGETTSDVVAALLKTEPAPPSDFNREIPAELDRVVTKTLVKDREERYQTAKDLLVDLRRLKKQIEIQSEVERTPSPNKTQNENSTQILASRPTSSADHAAGELRKRKLSLVVALSVLLLATVGLGYWLLKSRSLSGSSNSAPIESIAVLPFINASGNPDAEYLSDGITESLINNLSRLSSLRVIARSTVFSFKGRELAPQQIGKQLNVRAILTGRVVERGDRLSIQVDLVDADSGTQMWGEQYHRKQADILLVQEEIAREVTDRLRLRLTGEEQKLLTKRYTNNPEAYEYYLKGRYHYYKGNEAEWKQALESFNTAVIKDPNYALAYAGVADCYSLADAAHRSLPEVGRGCAEGFTDRRFSRRCAGGARQRETLLRARLGGGRAGIETRPGAQPRLHARPPVLQLLSICFGTHGRMPRVVKAGLAI